MLLPSAIPCDFFTTTKVKAQRPKLPSFDRYVAPFEAPVVGASNILASCRALQSILGGSASTASQCNARSNTQSSTQSDPFTPKRLKSPPPLEAPPRGEKKRSRDEFEDDNDMKENILPIEHTRDFYQTPKRQRRVPIHLPKGLLASDFESLNTPRELDQDLDIELPQENPGLMLPRLHSSRISTTRTQSRNHAASSTQRQSQPSCHVDAQQHECWSPSDDRRLVEAVLSKLNLTRREWNDCAKELGKDKDSLGRRWKMLVGEGNIGLRRGMGRIHERTSLDIRSW